MAIASGFPIIALWAHPRSMSTAIERIMRERNDLCCVHEPFIYYYYIALGKKNLPHFDHEQEKPSRFEDIFADLIDKSRTAPVFFKDMGYYMVPELFNHRQLARRLRHLILIRDPRKSILSYFKLDPDILLEEIGLEAQWRLYQWLCENCNPAPMIIEAESVQRDPVSAMTRVWRYLGMEMKPEAFQWDENYTPEDWKMVSGWHGDVQASTGIRKTESEDDETIHGRFLEAAARSPKLQMLLDHHQPFYQKLKAASQNQSFLQEI